MNFHTYYKDAEPVATCLVGTGDFGRSFIAQSQRMALVSTRIAVDVDAVRAATSVAAAGVPAAQVAICATASEARAAWDSGKIIATSDIALALDLPVDIVIEATGAPEAGAPTHRAQPRKRTSLGIRRQG